MALPMDAEFEPGQPTLLQVIRCRGRAASSWSGGRQRHSLTGGTATIGRRRRRWRHRRRSLCELLETRCHPRRRTAPGPPAAWNRPAARDELCLLALRQVKVGSTRQLAIHVKHLVHLHSGERHRGRSKWSEGEGQSQKLTGAAENTIFSGSGVLVGDETE
jgi:hypothetical protein